MYHKKTDQITKQYIYKPTINKASMQVSTRTLSQSLILPIVNYMGKWVWSTYFPEKKGTPKISGVFKRFSY